MVILDLNGKQVKHVTDSANLKEAAEKLLNKMLTEAGEQVSSLLKDFDEFPELKAVMEYPVKDFENKIEELKKIVKDGVLQTSFLGVPQEEDYTDMRKDLMKEAMYYIDNHKEQE